MTSSSRKKEKATSFFEKKEALDRKYYYGAGLFFGKYAKPTETPVSFSLEHTRISIYLFIAGFSLLQGGPLPTFLAEDQLQRIFKKDDLTNLGEAETQFRVGLERFGLVEVRFHCDRL